VSDDATTNGAAGWTQPAASQPTAQRWDAGENMSPDLADSDSRRFPIPQGGGEINLAGITLIADCMGALYWPDEGLLVVADLHLEKGSSFAERGVLLPPYDTAATLARLLRVLVRYAPRAVIALGDSFHDGDGPARLLDTDRETLHELQRGRDWFWIAGNHDPEPAAGVGGTPAATLAIGALTFRHLPSARAGAASNETADDISGEIAGHLHPIARVSGRGRTVSRRCFASDGRRLVMPAFGAYAGGLNVRDGAFAQVFGALRFTAHMLGEGRLYAIAAKRCLPD
jgi:DNA ligase-associated metallophosphoesterase